ncbi:MAG: hypothetical protein KUG71_07550 [Porticoccaceae bacterium]|nr:hypothetical protein [Porticoccaceae bacterium]
MTSIRYSFIRHSNPATPPLPVQLLPVQLSKAVLKIGLFRIALLSLLCAFAPATLSAVATNAAIPDSLKPWTSWVLKDQPDYLCPRIAQQNLSKKTQQKRCAWPGKLAVNVSAKQARFTQRWEVFGKSRLTLPGDARHWPKDVLVNNLPAIVQDIKGKPTIELDAGNYLLSGSLNWQKPPQYLPVAPETALIELNRDGKTVTAHIDQQGKLWLRDQRASETTGKSNDTLKVEVFRLLSDDIPMQVNTELRLAVAGKPRELVLGQFLPANTEAMEFNSPLPARIEADGRLRIQARAGQWRILLQARYLQPVTTFGMNKMDAQWPDQEVWSFRANPLLRGVKLSGLPAVDPSQIDIPGQFANLPTYLMSTEAGSSELAPEQQSLTLTEQYRGDASPAANRLKLNRTLWLDFDGGGATTKDDISGTFSQGWRLRSSPDLQLGRIVANGTPQLVTRMPGEASTGIEIRYPQVNVEAISRVEPLTAISASGWLHDFDQVSLSLRLPPGWQLWHAAGPDSIQSSWLSRWDLWDLFICLLIVGGLFRVIDWRWGLCGALTLALTYHESGAPLVGWVILVAALPLLTVLPSGKLKQVVNTVAHLTLAGLAVIVIVFAVQQVRKGIYPQLEQAHAINVDRYSYGRSMTSTKTSQVAQEEVARSKSRRESFSDNLAALDSAAPASLPGKQAPAPRYRPSDNIQTGPGEPSWQWRQAVILRWSGPVKADAPLTLYLSPPWLTRSLKFIQVFLVGLLLYGLGGRLLKHHWLLGTGKGTDKDSGNNPTGPTSSPAGITSSVLPLLFVLSSLVLSGTVAIPTVNASEFPSPELLKELKTTLLKAPDCAPQCGAVQSSHITLDQAGADKQRLLIRQRVSVATDLAFPLPADPSWQAESVLVDNQVVTLAHSNNKYWVKLSQGSHDIVLTGILSGDNISLPFPLTAHNTVVNAPGWNVQGLSRGSVSGGTLQFEKIVKQKQQDTLVPTAIKPFVLIQRQLNSDIDWQLVTTVTRIAPGSGAINLRVPLLEGESVVSQNLVIENQYASIALNARQRSVQWRSVIKPTEQLTFTAPNTNDWIEHWQIQASPRWHITGEGIPPIKTSVNVHNAGPLIQLWRPWPGESLSLRAVQPEPVPGPTTTVESAKIDYRPGARSAALTLSQGIRTSLGGDYRIPQPPNAKLQSMVIDGIEQTTPREDEHVVIPLHPGLQNIVLTWEQDQGVALNTTTPQFTLPTPANNIDITLQLPHDRWPILLNGPDIGPAMLYWGVLAIILIIAFLLGAIIKRQALSIPVNTWQWLLLALGMSTVNMVGSIAVVVWFFAMEARQRRSVDASSQLFNVIQVGLIGLSIIALISLFATIPQSLLSSPNMQVTGNGSSNYLYQWYQDHSADTLPQGWVFSLPLNVFRIAMLLWSLWIVFALMNWIKWGWQCLSAGQLWNNQPKQGARKKFGKNKAKTDPSDWDKPES